MGGGRDVGAADGGTLGWSEGARAVRLAGVLVAALVLFSRAQATSPPCRPRIFYLGAACLAAAGLPRACALVELNVEIGFRRGMPVVEESNFATHCPRAYAGQRQAPPPASSRRSGGGGRGGAGAAHGLVVVEERRAAVALELHLRHVGLRVGLRQQRLVTPRRLAVGGGRRRGPRPGLAPLGAPAHFPL